MLLLEEQVEVDPGVHFARKFQEFKEPLGAFQLHENG